MVRRFWEIGLTVYYRHQIQPTEWWNDTLPFRECHLILGWCSCSFIRVVGNSCETAASLSHEIHVWVPRHAAVPWEWKWQNCRGVNVCTHAQAHGAVAVLWEWHKGSECQCQCCFQGEGLVLVTAGIQGVLEMFSIYNDNKKRIAVSWNIYLHFWCVLIKLDITSTLLWAPVSHNTEWK